MEMVIIAIIGLLIFGRRLPEVGRGLGKSIVEFRKGLKDISDDIDTESSKPDQRGVDSQDRPERDLPKPEGRVEAVPPRQMGMGEPVEHRGGKED
jgi:sec-independent protein translocase protein TatA